MSVLPAFLACLSSPPLPSCRTPLRCCHCEAVSWCLALSSPILSCIWGPAASSPGGETKEARSSQVSRDVLEGGRTGVYILLRGEETLPGDRLLAASRQTRTRGHGM